MAQPWNSNQISKFNTLAAARSFTNRCKKIHMIVLGDDNTFWVTTPRIAEQLVATGYEYAE